MALPLSVTIVHTDRRSYWFDENLSLIDFTDPTDPFFDVSVLEPVNRGQFRNLYFHTNNYRRPKQWLGPESLVETDVENLSTINVIRAKTLEINNHHLIYGNIAKAGGGAPDTLGNIDNVSSIIDSISTPIDHFGTTEAEGYKRFNKTVVWSDVDRTNVWIPTANNQAGDIDIDEDGYEILRIMKLGEVNVAYKERSIFFLIHVGLPFVYVKKFFTDSVGIAAVNAIVEHNNVHYFVGHDFDIYKFDGVSLQGLSLPHDIREYIINSLDNLKLYQIHGFIDTELKEIYFTFERKESFLEPPFKRFDVVYNYSENHFHRRDSIAKTGGYFEQLRNTRVIDDFGGGIDEDGRIINQVDDIIDQVDPGYVIDSIQSTINNFFGLEGLPRRRLLIGDSEGLLYLFNDGDSFDGMDIYGYFETGDTDFATELKIAGLSNQAKFLSMFRLLADSIGSPHEIELHVGVRDSLDSPIRWKGPYTYSLNGTSKGVIPTRASGVYFRFKIVSARKSEFTRILGYVPRVENHGEITR